jgi:hypothetical protein
MFLRNVGIEPQNHTAPQHIKPQSECFGICLGVEKWCFGDDGGCTNKSKWSTCGDGTGIGCLVMRVVIVVGEARRSYRDCLFCSVHCHSLASCVATPFSRPHSPRLLFLGLYERRMEVVCDRSWKPRWPEFRNPLRSPASTQLCNSTFLVWSLYKSLKQSLSRNFANGLTSYKKNSNIFFNYSTFSWYFFRL